MGAAAHEVFLADLGEMLAVLREDKRMQARAAEALCIGRSACLDDCGSTCLHAM